MPGMRSMEHLRAKQSEMLTLHDEIAELKCDISSRSKSKQNPESKPQYWLLDAMFHHDFFYRSKLKTVYNRNTIRLQKKLKDALVQVEKMWCPHLFRRVRYHGS